ncbi:DUF1285 domain-containing protein [Aliidiomarina quisquiliarum]|uniref:DUF1285 domain-containing protein n=1 Tax=Aliidiomarina quisquiliarum TaxID=2938947 RepID=UPI00208E66BC|nr:DUF1285 domain-containing protein [Aliidiomarina quisquiliarum]MCO4322098.1 DUF1285 domain-containing protein [Aliidiomarina quisquiliarum]
MRLEELQRQLERQHRAPTERWNPAYCGDLDLIIKASGEWHYHGSPILRLPLVKLFASVLVHENNEYFLVTPAEKIRIQVEDLPFLITQWQYIDSADGPILQVETNIGERYLIGPQYPVVLNNGTPAVKIRDGLLARVHRNVYYQWAEQLQRHNEHEQPGYYLISGGCRFFISGLEV